MLELACNIAADAYLGMQLIASKTGQALEVWALDNIEDTRVFSKSLKHQWRCQLQQALLLPSKRCVHQHNTGR